MSLDQKKTVNCITTLALLISLGIMYIDFFDEMHTFFGKKHHYIDTYIKQSVLFFLISVCDSILIVFLIFNKVYKKHMPDQQFLIIRSYPIASYVIMCRLFVSAIVMLFFLYFLFVQQYFDSLWAARIDSILTVGLYAQLILSSIFPIIKIGEHFVISSKSIAKRILLILPLFIIICIYLYGVAKLQTIVHI